MKLACLLAVGPGIVSFRRGGNPFRAADLGRLPYLIPAKAEDHAPVCPALDDGAALAERAQPAPWVGRIEAGVLKSLGALFVLTVLACGFGVQHIAYTREKNKLGRQLRQKELELRAVTQAYRSLECQEALGVAQRFQQKTVNLARHDSVPGTAARRNSRSAGGREAKPAPTKAAGYVFSTWRPQVAEAWPPTRRGGTGG